MGELLKQAELLSQNPSMGKVFGMLIKLAQTIEELHPKIAVEEKLVPIVSKEEIIEKPKEKKVKKKK